MNDAVPACATCGFSVEWVRSSYRSVWFLFRDSRTTRTAGRYYFSPEGTPHYPGTHLLGSRSWHDGNWTAVQALGESLTATHRWDDGRPPLVLPEVRTVGDAACIRDGETLAGAIPDGRIIDGFPPDCFTTLLREDPAWQDASAIEQCPVQRVWAWVLYKAYADDTASITDFLRLWLGTGFTITHVAQTDTLPRLVILVAAKWTVVVADGTRNFQTFALQAFDTLLAPTNFGNFGGAQLHFGAANYIHAQLQAAGANGIAPILVVGHSYGAAAVSMLAAIYRFAHDTREIVILTYGIPKPGDRRLIRLMDECRQVHLQNDEDIICILPPDRTERQLLVPIVGFQILTLWNGWERTTLPFRQDANGVIRRQHVESPDLNTLGGYVIDAIAGLPLAVVVAHRIDVYLARIQSRCDGPAWPVDKDESDALYVKFAAFGEVALLGEGVREGSVKLASVKPGKTDSLRLAEGGLPPTYPLEISVIHFPDRPFVRLTDPKFYDNPRPNCFSATLLTVNVVPTYGFWGDGATQWFYFVPTIGLTYTFYVEVYDGSFSEIDLFEGSCTAIFPVAILPGPGSGSLPFLSSIGPNFFFVIFGGAMTYKVYVTQP